MKNDLIAIARQYTALVKLADKYPQLCPDARGKSKMLVCVHDIGSFQEIPTITLYRHDATAIFETFGNKRADWQVKGDTVDGSILWNLTRIVDGVLIRIAISGENDGLLSMLQDDESDLQLNAKAAGGAL